MHYIVHNFILTYIKELKVKEETALLELNGKDSQLQSIVTKVMFCFMKVFPEKKL